MKITGTTLRFAAELGGGRLVSAVSKLSEWCKLPFPITRNEALRYLGIGKATIPGLIQLGIVKEDEFENELNQLSPRVQNVLYESKIKSKQEILDKVRSGDLRVGKTRNLGWKSYLEICAWLGIPKPEKPRKMFTCPHCGTQSPANPIKVKPKNVHTVKQIEDVIGSNLLLKGHLSKKLQAVLR